MELKRMDRRGFLRGAGLAAPALWLGSRLAWGQAVPELVVQARAAAANAKIVTVPLRGGVSVLQGSGGNIAVLVGKGEKVLVDSGYSTSKPQVLAALDALGKEPVTRLINTHWHFDHTDGNEWVHDAGAVVCAHAKTRERLSTVQTIAAFHATFPAAPEGAWPTWVFDTARKLRAGGELLELEHYAPAHTDTDIWVHFPQADVLHAGDTWFNGFYPLIDYSTGGSIDGMIAAADKTLAFVGADTQIVPGHGPVGTRAELASYREMLVGCRASVAAIKKQGKTLAETVAAKPTAAFDAKWGQGFMKPEAFVGLVYQGV